MKKMCYISVLDRVVKYFYVPHINALPNDEFDVTCITNISDDHAFDKINKDLKKYNVEIARNVNPVNMLVSMIKIYKIFKREKFDIIQYTGPSTSLICSLVGAFAKIPVRQYCLWGIRYEGFNDRLKRGIFKTLEKISCKFSTNIIFDSENNRNFVSRELKVNKNKTSVIGLGSACGVDLNVFNISKKDQYNSEIRTKYNISNEDYVFGYLGRLSYDKGTNELLKACLKFEKEHSKVKFLIVGFCEEDDLDSQILIQAEESENIIFTGRSDEPEKYYATFDSYVFPSHREGYGGGCVQVGSYAVPSLVSDIRPLMDAIQNGEYGLYHKLGDWKDLYSKMEYMFNNREELKEIGAKMYDRVKDNFEQGIWQGEYLKHIKSQLEGVK